MIVGSTSTGIVSPHLVITASIVPAHLAVSGVIRSVAVPLLSAFIAAVGIVLPLALVARNERIKIGLQRDADHEKYRMERESERDEEERHRTQQRSDRIAQAVEGTRRDALLLRELITVLSAQQASEPESLSLETIATVRAARERLFSGLHENPELFATLVPAELQAGRRLEKLMLLLGLLECRLREFEQTQQLDTGLTLFGLDFLVRAVDPTSLHSDTLDALQVFATRDQEAAAFFSELLDHGETEG
jgi:hypothetical protein